MLTTQTTQAYSPLIASSDVIGIGLLSKAAISRNAPSNVAFLRLVLPFMGGLGGEPQGSPVRFPGSPTRPVPSTRLDSGVRLNQLNESEYIMTGNPLIPVFTGILQNDSVQLCNARDLHTFLQIRKDFSTWIKDRIHQYGFIEREDYSPILGNRSGGTPGKPRTEYHLTLDMAKELAMVENNEQGKAARRYFIELERSLIQKANSNTQLKAIIAGEQRERDRIASLKKFDAELTAKFGLNKQLMLSAPRKIRSRDDLSFTKRNKKGNLINWFIPNRVGQYEEHYGMGEIWFDEIVTLAKHSPKEAFDAIRFSGLELCKYSDSGHALGFMSKLGRWALAAILECDEAPFFSFYPPSSKPPREGMDYYLNGSKPKLTKEQIDQLAWEEAHEYFIKRRKALEEGNDE
ncbi:antA/AntB antirepressor family protein [Methylotenera sp.]|uniref:antA/AntB antirepressor family protein n=1 Tax=Methylotenera sp. TaxID=2051956 RepID=UPI0027193067|nr:antA/AntB antirepressor family protein [Methylotenera sp.]MDO9205610.1 antA/AntB antirepressor family protein [Methylotenera sp.]MDP2071827.1 antA/AntB antirepressor family protein [Methylotenera sp.]